jgi:Major Facilitator Superfamily
MSMNPTKAVSLVIIFLLGCISTEAFATRPALWQRQVTSSRMDRSPIQLISLSKKRSSSSTTLKDQNNNENKDESDNDLMRTNGSIHTVSDSTMSAIDYTTMKPQVYSQRWVQLGYLSILALLSDWICFSVAATPQTFENCFPGHSAASLIDIFLFTNVASCFLVTDVVAKIGLQRAIQFAATLMTIGCWFRSGWGFIGNGGILDHLSLMASSSTTTTTLAATTTTLVPYAWVVAGTILVGAAQPFFQCTPPLLSAQWFGSDERATSTAVALNFNQIGIATAFLVGGSMATSKDGLSQYFGLVAVLCTLATIGTWIFFQAKPPSPPSTSELEKLIRGEHEPPFWESVQTFFRTPGFTKPLAAFVCSITITNVVGVSET